VVLFEGITVYIIKAISWAKDIINTKKTISISSPTPYSTSSPTLIPYFTTPSSSIIPPTYNIKATMQESDKIRIKTIVNK